MELRPTKDMKVRVNALREAVFGEESVEVKKITFKDEKSRIGSMTGVTLAGYCEVDMPNLDKRKHWYPIGDLVGENGEGIVEEEVKIDLVEDDENEDEQE
jgi:hypothetical protein